MQKGIIVIVVVFFLSCFSWLLKADPTSTITIHFYKPSLSQVALLYREQPTEKYRKSAMKLNHNNWWKVAVDASLLEFYFASDDHVFDLGRTNGCYSNDHFQCQPEPALSESFRTSAPEIWIKEGLIYIQNPVAQNKDKEVFTLLTLNLHTYQEIKTDKKNESDLSYLDAHKRVADHNSIFNNIASVINQLEPDLICLQEVGEWKGSASSLEFGADETNAAKQIIDRLNNKNYQAYMDWSHYGWNVWKEGTAILSRHPLSLQESRYISRTENGTIKSWQSRKITKAQIQANQFGKINIFSIHTGWWESESEPFSEQFSRLMEWVKQSTKPIESTIMCGDFNQVAATQGYQLMIQDSGFSDQYLKANPQGMFDATIGGNIDGWEQRQVGNRIDYILLNDSSLMQVKQSQRVFTEKVFGRVSDHVGIYAQFIVEKIK